MARSASHSTRVTPSATVDGSLDYPCVEHGIWTPIPRALPKSGDHRLKLKAVDTRESQAVKRRGTMTFHAVGCSGCFEDPRPGLMVANAMAAQAADPKIYDGHAKAHPASFLYHLGDIAYKADHPTPAQKKVIQDRGDLIARQFYAQFNRYRQNIFAIAGNHDAKTGIDRKRSAITHFLENFCDAKRRRAKDSPENWRKTMVQPYPYWLLETPVAYFIGLATNDINAGQLDDPMGTTEPQYDWLLRTLAMVKTENAARCAKKLPPKVVILALHYPPFSGSPRFAQRGDPNLGPTPRPSLRAATLVPLAAILHQAFHLTQQYPDIVLCAHAHLYQRITYTLGMGRQIPYLIAGCGGHGPLEKFAQTCWGASVSLRPLPLDVTLPPGLAIPDGDKVQVVAFNDKDFGFLRLTIDAPARKLVGEFFACEARDKSTRKDSFTLDLEKSILL